MKIKTKLSITALGASNFITVLANTILFPIFPAMKKALNLSLTEISLLVLFVSFPAALLNPIGGVLADSWGRKKIIVPSLFTYGTGGLICGLAIVMLENPYPLVLGGRILQGIGSAMPMYLTTALAGDIFQSKERNKAMGFLETSNGLGKLFSPLIGAAAGVIIWYAPFFIYPLVTFPVAIIIWILIKEPDNKKPLNIKESIDTFKLFYNNSRMLSLLIAFISLFILIGTLFWMSDFLETRLDGGKIIRGLILSLPLTSLIIVTLFSGWLNEKLGPRLNMILGTTLLSLSFLFIPFVAQGLLLWPLVLILGGGAGMILPALDTVSSAVTDKNHRALFTTIFGSFRCLGAAAAPLLLSV
ncbi:MAG: MFS transporter, partial [Candidatus Syntrophonatronum acetioxidans]